MMPTPSNLGIFYRSFTGVGRLARLRRQDGASSSMGGQVNVHEIIYHTVSLSVDE